MTEEEKKAIENLDKRLTIEKHTKNIGTPVYISDLAIALNLIQKQGKALQALKNSIPKEVIENKRNTLEKQYKEELEKNSTKAFILKCQIEILKELLEENKND